LTGRRGLFGSLRKLDGLSGFPKVHESVHDAFGTGHSSTAISAALGLAVARDSLGKAGKVVAVVGDGSMTGGLAYEGLNNAGRADTDLLVVLNDNQMSIGKNVGAVARHLNEIRTTPAYLRAKRGAHTVLDNLPLVGAPLSRVLESTKDVFKFMLLKGVLFEELGFKYIGLVDGHDASALLSVLNRVKDIKGPVLLHVLTKKGKGHNRAERLPSAYHGVGTFCVHTGKLLTGEAEPSYTDVFSKFICRLAAIDEKIAAVSAAMSDGTGLTRFKERFPARFFDVGIAEGHAVTFAAGLAQGGLRPVVCIYSSFLQRAYDQILHDVAIQGLPVVFAIDHGGAVAGDGETHQGIFDLAYLSHIPGLTVLAPSCAKELTNMLDFAFTQTGPVAIRYPKAVAPKRDSFPLIYGRAEKLPDINGEAESRIAIVSVGAMLETAMEVVQKLNNNGHKPALFNARFIKPLDMDLAVRLADFDYVFTIEDGVRIGGYGSRLLAELLQTSKPPRFYSFAFPDSFPGIGTRAELFKKYKLDADSIAKKIDNLL